MTLSQCIANPLILDLQYNPVSFFGSLFHGNLSHSVLALAQGHIVKLPKVNGKTQFTSCKHT